MTFVQTHTTFFDQSDAWLSEMERSILQLTVAEDERACLDAICLIAHELKNGAAACDSVPRLAMTAHMLEDAIDEIISREIAVNPAIIRLMLDAKDVLKAQSDRYRHGLDQDDAAFRRICTALRSVCDLGLGATSRHSQDPHAVRNPWLMPHGPAAPAAPAMPVVTMMPAPHCVAIAVDQLLELERLGCELANAQRIVSRASTALDAGQHACILKSLGTLACQTRALQRLICSLRMESVACLFGHCSRVAHDLALALSKPVEVKISGEAVELERQVVQALHDALTLLVRHSVAHGIECSDVRAAAGKPRSGHLRLSAQRSADEAIIEFCDDGAGLGDDPVLDQARQSIAALGGRFTVECVPGQGTAVQMRLPVALELPAHC